MQATVQVAGSPRPRGRRTMQRPSWLPAAATCAIAIPTKAGIRRLRVERSTATVQRHGAPSPRSDEGCCVARIDPGDVSAVDAWPTTRRGQVGSVTPQMTKPGTWPGFGFVRKPSGISRSARRTGVAGCSEDWNIACTVPSRLVFTNQIPSRKRQRSALPSPSQSSSIGMSCGNPPKTTVMSTTPLRWVLDVPVTVPVDDEIGDAVAVDVAGERLVARHAAEVERLVHRPVEVLVDVPRTATIDHEVVRIAGAREVRRKRDVARHAAQDDGLVRPCRRESCRGTRSRCDRRRSS